MSKNDVPIDHSFIKDWRNQDKYYRTRNRHFRKIREQPDSITNLAKVTRRKFMPLQEILMSSKN